MILMMDLSFQVHFVKLFESCREQFKPFNLSFKKDFSYFKMNFARCPHCSSQNIVKYGFTNRKLVFKEIE